jgi:hypothetical protein
MAGSITGNVIPAPGAMVSPQAPGMRPDRTTIPTHVDEPTPPVTVKVRPLTQYGTAEELIDAFRQKPMDQLKPSDFEQAPATAEEMRKANPLDLTPIRPLPPLGSGEPIPEIGSVD